MRKNVVQMKQIVEKMNLKNLTPDVELSDKVVEVPDINRPALQLTGFFERFDSERVQVIGYVEYSYLTTLEEKKKEDGPEFQLKIQSIYRAYFNHSHHFYYEQDAEYILTDLSQDYEGQEFLTRIDMLSELLYQDALLKEPDEKKYLLAKALYLKEYLDSHSDTFSFERRNKINEIKKLLEL